MNDRPIFVLVLRPEKSVADPLAARNWRSALALRKNLKSRLVNVGPREDQKHNCRRDKQR
jgi:hypothetical protein